MNVIDGRSPFLLKIEPEVQFELAVYVVDVVFGERDGVVEHVLELGQHVGDLPDDHGQGRDAGVRPGSYVGALRDYTQYFQSGTPSNF